MFIDDPKIIKLEKNMERMKTNKFHKKVFLISIVEYQVLSKELDQ